MPFSETILQHAKKQICLHSGSNFLFFFRRTQGAGTQKAKKSILKYGKKRKYKFAIHGDKIYTSEAFFPGEFINTSTLFDFYLLNFYILQFSLQK